MPNQNSSVRERIVEVVAKQLGMNPSKVTAESTTATLGVDSMEAVDIIMAIEDEFDIEVPDEACGPLVTFVQLEEMVTKQLSTRNA